MINKYIKKLEYILGNSIIIRIFIDNEYKNLHIDHLNYIKNTNGLLFKIYSNDIEVSNFRLVQMIGCCGICVSTGVYVHNQYRNIGINTILNNFRIDIAKELGYGILLCTDVSDNIAEVKTLDKNGWKHVYNFRNPRTSNKINISIKELN